jgi:iron(II)-dependent oxidoreductase
MGSPAIADPSADRSADPGADRSATALADSLQQARQRTLALVAELSEQELETVHSSLMSPLVWDLGHIAAFEDLWIAHRLGGEPLLRDDLMDVYDAFETPRAHRGNLPFLRPREARGFIDAVRERTLTLLAGDVADPLSYELVIRHELQHEETMMQTMALAQLPAGGIIPPPSPPRLGLQTVTVPAGTHTIGAPGEGFAYDNERPQWQLQLPSFEIGEVPVSNGEYREFIASGEHERPGGWTADLQQEWRVDGLHELDPAAPVMHVSWDQAAAFAQAHGARLPTEFEWEAAARKGALQGTGHVWEWTSSHFEGYPGFVAHPYREYSEVFFGDNYRVLRGSSWATSARVATPTFRNWDFPVRRQIFNGLRIARDS